MNSEEPSDHDEPVSEFGSEVGSRLRVLESEFKNRADVAYRAGVSKSTFQRWIEGKADPSFRALAKLAAATGFSLDWLAFGRGEMRPGRTPPKEERPSVPALDEDLMARLVDGITAAYKDAGQGLAPVHLGRMAARLVNEIVAASDGPEDYPGALKMRLAQLRNELRSAATDPASSKRSA